MMLPHQIRAEAEADLAEAYQWYEHQREGFGADFLLCFDEALRRVCRNPDLYPLVHKTVRRGWIRRFPYGLFYKVDAEVVVVIGVFHASRDSRCWQSR